MSGDLTFGTWTQIFQRSCGTVVRTASAAVFLAIAKNTQGVFTPPPSPDGRGLVY